MARISTRRQVLTLLDSSGASLAEIAADDVSAQTLGEETVISQWGEVEVELTGGGPRLLRAADAQLRKDGLPSCGRGRSRPGHGWCTRSVSCPAWTVIRLTSTCGPAA